MKKLQLLLVGGFLASGKTTAIYHAVRCLKRENRKAGVISNDQGTFQVDAEWLREKEIPTVEVSGGCFCCHYETLEERIGWLLQNVHPEVIFAEPVGSCVDLAATVVNPLLTLNPGGFDVVLSVFADSRLLMAFLRQQKTTFSDSVNYIYEKQLRESDILVVNKVDLLSDAALAWLKREAGREFGDKPILFQNSLSEESVSGWLALCDQYRDRSLRTALDIDYDVYGAGEAQLAWLDEEIGIVSADGHAIAIAQELMRMMYERTTANGCSIGHLKFLLDDGDGQQKISFTSSSDPLPDWMEDARAERAVIMVNARIQTAPETLQLLVRQIIVDLEADHHCRITEYNQSAFQPGYPRPTHRITAVM